jgi:hypothetical protein
LTFALSTLGKPTHDAFGKLADIVAIELGRAFDSELAE